ncbi:MAG: HAD family hydrolase [Erysipelotrichaceae bacterium]|nr:HAD family hydrolase [Erysipelotrichaceae bacterium]
MELIEQMREYALAHGIPIMQDEGITFMLEFIKDTECKNILEIGTAIGYSAILMCGCHEDIHVTTIERDEERYQEAVRNVKAAGLEDRITLIFADALECEITGSYDFIFIDAAKAQYRKFFEKYSPLLIQNGYIFTDNLAFHGLVENPELAQSRGVRALVRKIKAYNDWLSENEEYRTQFLDLGDGVAISQRNRLDVKGMIFDMDGLLLDTETIAGKGMEHASKALNVPLPENFHEMILGKAVPLIKEIYETHTDGRVSYEEFKDCAQAYEKIYQEENGVNTMKGVVELLEHCKQRDIKVIVATSSYLEKAVVRMKLAGIYKYFDTVISGDMVQRSKPNPDIFLKAQETLGLAKNDCIIFEDSNAGVEAGVRAGMRVCMVPGMVGPEKLAQERAFQIFDSLQDAVEFFQ